MTTDTIARLLVADLHESPFNERKTFDEAALQSLADNLKHEGILQPLLVRPRVPELFKGDENATAGFEVVCGHRRLRAAALAGLVDVPCVVRPMTDAEAKSAQVSENLQRENVHALEEAEALRSLMEDEKVSVEDLITRTGKSRSYIYGRLKLLSLAPAVRKAFSKGEIVGEIALVFARMASEKLQLHALERVLKDYRVKQGYSDGGKDGYRAVRDFLVEHYTLDLKGALWDLDDAGLLPPAGACTTCPKRTGRTPELFDDIVDDKTNTYGRRPAGANVCTDPDCFAEKKKLQLKREQAALESKGQVVVAGGAARNAISAGGDVKGAFIELSAVKDAIKGKDVQVVTIQNPRDGKTKKAVKLSDLKDAGVKVKAQAVPSGSYEADRLKREAAHKREEEKWEIEAIARRKLLDVTRAAIASGTRSTFDLQHIARMALAGVAWNNRDLLADLWHAKNGEAIEKRIGSMTADEAARFMLDCALVENVAGSSYLLERKPEALLAFAKHYGVDVSLARIGGLTPTPAAQAKPKAATGKKSAPAAAGAEPGAAAATAVSPTPAKSKAKQSKAEPAAAVAAESLKEDAGVAGEEQSVEASA